VRARGPHNACRLFVHLVWHTWRRRPFLRASDVPIVAEAISRAGQRTRVRVLAQAVLTEHLHLLVRCAPDATVSAFVREAKSESARRVNETRMNGEAVKWCRGYFADSVSRSDVLGVRQYLARQHQRHPDRIPSG
jgi:REP element-mobilizing transposase RayT